MNNKPHVQRVIQRCGCDSILPFALVYIFYIILHGHLSPGGGFQGGVLMVAAVLLIYLGHGYDVTSRALQPAFMSRLEGLAVTLYIAIAMLGVVAGAQFCQNVAFQNGNIGDLISSGTISWMDEAVGLNVLTGVTVLSLSMLGLLIGKDVDYVKDEVG
ncbi:MAG: MnhB domain-containing protein [Oscillospiraceae bacterium]|nr:MnhB domain-containing protein [Oscillospiraceae bacterium]